MGSAVNTGHESGVRSQESGAEESGGLGMTGRYYHARLRAMESSPTVYPSARASRASSEFVRETSLGFGRPDYRSSSIEIGSGRLNKRVINVTSLHSNDQ